MTSAEDMNRLCADLEASPRETWPFVARALGRTAERIKDRWAENLGGVSNPGSAFKHVGRSIDYDLGVSGVSLAQEALGIRGGGRGLEAEIGPNLAKPQGTFAGWFEEGQANIPALHPGQEALRANEADFEAGIAAAIDDGLRKAGLA